MDESIKANCKLWFRFLQQVRAAVFAQGFEEVVTPTLVPSGAMEAELYPFQTQWVWGQTRKTFELPTSPEFHLKKLLAAGWGSLFEIKSCFRNEEYSDLHRPEFTMLEFYEVGADSKTLQQTIKTLMQNWLTQAGVDKAPQWKVVKIADLFAELGLPLTPKTTPEELRQWCVQAQILTDPTDHFNDLFFRIWLEKIEPYFDPEVILIVEDFPPSQAALAALNAEGWADRFEIYWKGFELGNAFYELQDENRLRERYLTENQKRKKMGRAPHPVDDELLWATSRLPKCSGIAIGLERLFMALYGFKSIAEFKLQDAQLGVERLSEF